MRHGLAGVIDPAPGSPARSRFALVKGARQAMLANGDDPQSAATVILWVSDPRPLEAVP